MRRKQPGPAALNHARHTQQPLRRAYTVTVVGTYSGSITLPPQTVTLAYEIQ